MKLSKNFVQISATAIITSLVMIIPIAAYEAGPFFNPPAPSERITWNQAVVMQGEYDRHRPLRVRYPEGDRHGERQNLLGFRFSYAQLNELLNNNKSGVTPDEVYFQLGQEGEFADDFIGGLFRDSGHMRLIAVGLKNNVLLIKPAAGTDISLFDKADPCPPNCPKLPVN